MVWLITKLTDVVRDIIFGILAVVVEFFTDTLSLTSNEFYQLFWQSGDVNLLAKLQNEIIFPLSVALLLLIMVVQLYRSMFSKKADAQIDEPAPLVFRTVIFLFLSLNWNLLLYGTEGINASSHNSPCLVNLYANIWKLIDKSFLSPQAIFDSVSINGTFANQSILDTFKDIGMATLASGLGLEVLAGIISIIIGLVLGWFFVKMMFVYVYRFVEVKIIELFAPLGLSAGGSSVTQDITKKYFRLYISSIISLLLSAIFTYIYCFLMASVLTWKGTGLVGNIMILAMTLGVYQIYNKIDGYLAQIGLTNISNTMPPRFPGMALSNAMRMGESAKRMSSNLISGFTGGKGSFSGASMSGSSGAGGFSNILGMAAKGASEARSAGNGSSGIGGFAKDVFNNAQDIMAQQKQAQTAMDAISGKGSNTSSSACDSIGAQISKAGIQPFTVNGQKANSSNSAISMISDNGDGTASVTNLAMDGATGEWVDLSSGKTISNDAIADMQSNLAGGGLPDDNKLAISTMNPDGSMSTTNLERNSDGQWANAETGNTLSASERASLNNALKDSGNTSVASLSENSISDFNSSDLSDSVQEASADANGVTHGAFHTSGGTLPVQFKEDGSGGISATVGEKTYGSPEEAAKAVGASSADVYNGAPGAPSSKATLGNGSKGYKLASIKESNVNPENASRFARSLNNCAVKGPKGNRTVNGMMKTATGESIPVTYTSDGNGGWSASARGNTYSSPQSAADAVGAKSVDLYSGSRSISSAMNESGNLNNAFMDTANITGGKTRSAMPENQGFKVISAGNNEIHGVYADMKGNVKGFSGSVVDQRYANSHPGQCMKINSGSQAMYMRINDGTSNAAVNNYAANTEFRSGQFINKYDSHTHLNEDGLA